MIEDTRSIDWPIFALSSSKPQFEVDRILGSQISDGSTMHFMMSVDAEYLWLSTFISAF
jgi:hypothetical protein